MEVLIPYACDHVLTELIMHKLLKRLSICIFEYVYYGRICLQYSMGSCMNIGIGLLVYFCYLLYFSLVSGFISLPFYL